jgi:hypothetical protein
MVTNTGTEDFALADIGRLTFTVELFHSTPMQGSRLGMALKASNVVGNPVTLHQIW